MHFVYYLYLLILFCLFGGLCGWKDERTLLNDLFIGYDIDARPRKNSSETIEVSVAYNLRRIDYLDLRQQIFASSGWVTFNWRDDYIRWNLSNYSNITNIKIPASSIWLPDVAIDNSAFDVYDGNHRNLFLVTVDNEGWVEWEPSTALSTICAVDTIFYPFDQQTCTIIFANWNYQDSEVNLTISESMININLLMTNGEWEIESTEFHRESWALDCCPDILYPEVVITIHIKRRYMSYVVNIIIPCVMMSLLTLFVFHLPADSGEKVSLGVTVLLTFTVFQLMIAETIPPSPQSIPVLEIYLLWFMAESCFSVIISVLVLNIHHRTEYKKPPDWLHNLVLVYLARILCMTSADIKSSKVVPQVVPQVDIKIEQQSDSEEECEDEVLTSSKIEDNIASYSYIDSNKGRIQLNTTSIPNDKSNVTHNLLSPNLNLPTPSIAGMTSNMHLGSASICMLSRHQQKSIIDLQDTLQRDSTMSRQSIVDALFQTFADLASDKEKKTLGLKLESEWKQIAKVVDRCFFIVALSLMMSSVLVIVVSEKSALSHIVI